VPCDEDETSDPVVGELLLFVELGLALARRNDADIFFVFLLVFSLQNGTQISYSVTSNYSFGAATSSSAQGQQGIMLDTIGYKNTSSREMDG
jgi:hypothetical protein